MKLLGIFVVFAILFVNPLSVKATQIDFDVSDTEWLVATKSGSLSHIDQLIQAGANVDAYDQNSKNTALMNAVESGNIEAVKLLVNSGANLNAITTVDGRKKCALTEAFCYSDILLYLIESGADIHIRLSQRKTPLHIAAESVGGYYCRASEENMFQALCILLQHGADVNAVDLYGKTPLHFALTPKAIRFKQPFISLLGHGANIHILDHYGCKPLHLAYNLCDIEILKEFLKRGASLHEFGCGGLNALQCACDWRTSDKESKLNLIRFLIEEQKLNVNQHSKWYDGRDGSTTAFMSAIRTQNFFEDDFEILEYLLHMGGDFNSQTYSIIEGKKRVHHKSVLSWAKDVNVPYYVIEWMVEHGAK